jgi:hypothetical protein
MLWRRYSCALGREDWAEAILENQSVLKLLVQIVLLIEEVTHCLRELKFFIRLRLISQLKALFISEIMHFAKFELGTIYGVLGFQVFPILRSIVSFNELLGELIRDNSLRVPFEFF